MDIVDGLGDPAPGAWQRALADPMLAPHARLVPAEAETGDAEEASEKDDAEERPRPTMRTSGG